MKNKILILVLSLIACCAYGQKTETLSIDTDILPQGKVHSSDKVKFKGGSTVNLNAEGKVISGELASDTDLLPAGKTFSSELVKFKGGCKVTFNTEGKVMSGGLALSIELLPFGKTFSSEKVKFKAGCLLNFSEEGKVLNGGLAAETELMPQGKVFNSDKIKFKEGCPVTFNSKGDIISGALAYDSELLPQGRANPYQKEKYTAGTFITFNEKGEVLNTSSRNCNCDCNPGPAFNYRDRDNDRLDKFINGKKTDYEETVISVFKRNSWKRSLVVADITEGMYPYDAQVYLWIKNYNANEIQYLVFFNDGDGKADRNKVIGATGGIYGSSYNTLPDLLSRMRSASANGTGGDSPENDIEALLYGIDQCPTCMDIILVCDNNATPRDISLLYKVNKPVKVIACGVNGFVNPVLLDIAYKTKGSLHTFEEDISDISKTNVGGTIKVAGRTYKLYVDGFRYEY